MSTMMDVETEEGAPRVRFPSRERRGALLGLSLPQLIVVCIAAALIVGSVWFGMFVFSCAAGLAALMVILAVARYHRESVMLIIWRTLVFMFRSGSGQTKYRRDVTADDRRVSYQAATSELSTAPHQVASYVLPGALGETQIIDVPGHGGFAFDARSGLASMTIGVGAAAWELRDPGAKEAAYQGMVDLLSSLEHMQGLYEATLRVRVDRASTSHLVEYLQEQEFQHAPAVSDEVKAEYFKAIRQASSRSMAFTMFVTATFDTRAMSAMVRQAGGGLKGIAAILVEREAVMRSALEHAGVRPEQWWSANDLELAITNAADPVAVARQRERAASSQHRQIDVLPVMAIDEEWANVHINESWHSTSWIAEWPRTETRTAFLQPLLYAGNHSRVLALQLRPVPTHKALAEVERAQADMESAAQIRMKLRSNLTVQHLREADALHEREEDLADGYGDVSYRGFVSVSAESEEAVKAAQSQIVDAAHQCRVLLSPMVGQQAAALVTAAMPVSVDRPKKNK